MWFLRHFMNKILEHVPYVYLAVLIPLSKKKMLENIQPKLKWNILDQSMHVNNEKS